VPAFPPGESMRLDPSPQARGLRRDSGFSGSTRTAITTALPSMGCRARTRSSSRSAPDRALPSVTPAGSGGRCNVDQSVARDGQEVGGRRSSSRPKSSHTKTGTQARRSNGGVGTVTPVSRPQRQPKGERRRVRRIESWGPSFRTLLTPTTPLAGDEHGRAGESPWARQVVVGGSSHAPRRRAQDAGCGRAA